MPRKKTFKLLYKIILTLVLINVLPLLLANIILNTRVQALLEETVRRSLREGRDYITSVFDNGKQQLRSTGKELAEQAAFLDLLQRLGKNPNNRNLQSELERVMAEYSLSRLAVFKSRVGNAGNKVLVDKRDGEFPKQLPDNGGEADTQVTEEIRGGKSFSRVELNKSGLVFQAFIPLYIQRRPNEQKPDYLLTIGRVRDLSFLNELSDALKKNFILMDGQRNVRLSTMYNRWGEPLQGSRIELEAAGKALQKKESRYQEDSWLGKPCLYLFTPIYGSSGDLESLCGVAHVIEYEEEQERIFTFLQIITGISLLMTLLASIMLSRSVVVPVNILMDGVTKLGEQIDQGREPSPIELANNDELSLLADEFNTMAVEIFSNHNELRQYSENLEAKVHERTKKLEEAFEDIKALKVRQDGDYFLTSLLLQPLQVHNNTNPALETGMYLEQKKKFQFRHRKGEIGGDLCIIDMIRLRGKPYTVFANGDAMGKSLQGAGGALVMGVVFNAIVSRTNNIGAVSDTSPELWLRSCYKELRSIFTSFDGSMLISAVIGMVDSISGVMYYFNAEHPWVVRYAEGKAEFVENELVTRKIGTVGLDMGVVVRQLILNPGDVIMSGTDGRDDILQGIDEETGNRIINEDETRFLRHVEKGQGKLAETVANIKLDGELTDDIGLIRFQYLGQASPGSEKRQEAEALFEDGKRALADKDLGRAVSKLEAGLEKMPDRDAYKMLMSCYELQEKHSEAAGVLEDALWYYADDRDLVYHAAFAWKRLRDYRLAGMYADRIYTYEPDNVNNLVNYVDIKRLEKDFDRAETLLKRLVQLDPENKYIPRFKKALARAGKKL